ncbi:hypothetical protein FRC18_010420 [Serendipita sp. 400]|nr:hypothetical protein FRC18_010420 [Serendipita sp. 400]
MLSGRQRRSRTTFKILSLTRPRAKNSSSPFTLADEPASHTEAPRECKLRDVSYESERLSGWGQALPPIDSNQSAGHSDSPS